MENIENGNFDEDAGYPQSPDSDVPESTFSNPNRVRETEISRPKKTEKKLTVYLQSRKESLRL